MSNPVHRISLSAGWLAKSARGDYARPAAAWLREALQNARDAGSKNVAITLSDVHGDGRDYTRVIIRDDGRGMNRTTLVEKFMALGASSKDGASLPLASSPEADAIGGFGVAKVILAFSHVSYRIRTRDVDVSGSGSEYSFSEPSECTDGLELDVVLNPDVIHHHPHSLADLFVQEIALSNLPGINITVDGTTVAAAKARARKYDEFDGVVVTRRRLSKDEGGSTSRVSVRCRGLHMFFISWHLPDWEVAVEIDAARPTLVLTSYRDSLKAEIHDRVCSILRELSAGTDRDKPTRVEHVNGLSSRVSARSLEEFREAVGESLSRASLGESFDHGAAAVEIARLALSLGGTGTELRATNVDSDEESPANETVLRATVAIVETALAEASQAGSDRDAKTLFQTILRRTNLAHHYFVETKGFRTTPKAWLPQNFTSRQREILQLWADVLALVLRDASRPGQKFDVGFFLEKADAETDSDATLALYRRQSEGEAAGASGHLFLLNPLIYGDRGRLPYQRSRRLELVMWMTSLATHEVTHFLGHSWHDSSFIKEELAIRRAVAARMKDYLALAKRR